MALVWQCDRCDAVDSAGNVDDPPEGWSRRVLPVRGSKGARSDGAYVLCTACDDSLYEWWKSTDRG